RAAGPGARSGPARPCSAGARGVMMASGTPIIEIEQLNVTFGDHEAPVHAVRNVSFRVDDGESFGLVGESGSGKSTVLRAVSALKRRGRGGIGGGGAAQAPRRTRAFHKLVQMVFQDPYGSLHPRHTVDGIVAEPIAIHRLSGADPRIESVLADVGLGPAFRF